jgi:antirestriction protein ArdC
MPVGANSLRKSTMKDLYTDVTNRIIAALEQGTPPWVCPWQDGGALPLNLVTGKAYRGVNVPILFIEAATRPYPDHRWLTFRQAQALGAHVRKGEHGTAIVFYRLRAIGEAPGDATAPEPATPRAIPLLKTYIVFNAHQLDDLPERYVLQPPVTWQPIEAAERLIQQSNAVIVHGGPQAFYRPSDDCIQLPPQTGFAQPEAYYATALHELCHWTGHPSRLNRVLGRRHGIEAYAYEELIAEMGAAFLCAHCGLSSGLQHASYIDAWLDALRRDKRLIFVAAGAAQKAADFVVGTACEAPKTAAEEVAA